MTWISFIALLTLCEGNPLLIDGVPHKVAVLWSFAVFFAVIQTMVLKFHKKKDSSDTACSVLSFTPIGQIMSKCHRCHCNSLLYRNTPDNKVHGANMGPTWVLSAPDGRHVGPMNLAIRDGRKFLCSGSGAWAINGNGLHGTPCETENTYMRSCSVFTSQLEEMWRLRTPIRNGMLKLTVDGLRTCFKPQIISLTPEALGRKYGGIDLGPHWLRWWLVAWRYQAITWTNVDLSSVRFSDKHLRVFVCIPLSSLILS